MRRFLCFCALLGPLGGCGGSTTTTRTTTSVAFEGGTFIERLETVCQATRTGFAEAGNDRQATRVLEQTVRRLDALEPDQELAEPFEAFRESFREDLEAFRARRELPTRGRDELNEFRRPLQRAGAPSC